METLGQDIKYAARMLINNRGVTLAAAFSLALGIGANTAIFTFVQGVFYPPLPAEDPARLVSLYTDDPKNPGFHSNSYANYEDFRDRNEVFSGLLTYRHISVSFRDGEAAAEQLFAEMVSGDYFDTLGVVPAAGRTFRPDEDQTPGTHAVAVLGYSFWQRQYAGDPEVIGRTIHLNRHPFTIIGVAAQDFTGLDVGLDLQGAFERLDGRRVVPLAAVYLCQGGVGSSGTRVKLGVELEDEDGGVGVLPSDALRHADQHEVAEVIACRTVVLGAQATVFLSRGFGALLGDLAHQDVADVHGRQNPVVTRRAIDLNGRIRAPRKVHQQIGVDGLHHAKHGARLLLFDLVVGDEVDARQIARIVTHVAVRTGDPEIPGDAPHDSDDLLYRRVRFQYLEVVKRFGGPGRLLGRGPLPDPEGQDSTEQECTSDS